MMPTGTTTTQTTVGNNSNNSNNNTQQQQEHPHTHTHTPHHTTPHTSTHDQDHHHQPNSTRQGVVKAQICCHTQTLRMLSIPSRHTITTRRSGHCSRPARDATAPPCTSTETCTAVPPAQAFEMHHAASLRTSKSPSAAELMT